MRRGHNLKKRGSRHSRSKKRLLGIALAVLLLLVVANGVMWVAYRNRVLPNVSLGSLPLGNVSYDKLDMRATDGALLPEHIALQTPASSTDAPVEALGLQVDIPASIDSLKSQRTAFPLLSLVRHRTVPVALTVDRQMFDSVVSQLAKAVYVEPLPERVAFEGETFLVASPSSGYEAENSFGEALLAALRNGQSQLQVPVRTLDPPANGDIDLTTAQQMLNKQIATKITYIYGGQPRDVPAKDKGTWYVQDGQSMRPDTQRITEYVQRQDETAGNANVIAEATLYALASGNDTQAVVSPVDAPVKRPYCTAVRGVDQAELTKFTNRVASILVDPRGWNLDGRVSFTHVTEGCEFTIWLSSPDSMTSFGGLCDSYYSCRSGTNVVINYDRWTKATDPWNTAGKSISDYEALVVNHEVGHRLGFDHLKCPGAGQPAPVMMQQSIELGGCVFNPWPVQSELNALKAL